MKATFGQIKNGYSSIFIKKKKINFVGPTNGELFISVCVCYLQ